MNQTITRALCALTACALFSVTGAFAAPTAAPSPSAAPTQPVAPSPTPSATSPASASPSPSASTSPDSDFVQTATQTELGLYGLASLGQKKASNGKLKQLAKALQKSANDAYRFLYSYAKKHSMSIEKKPDLRTAAQYSNVQGLSGKNFDQQFGKALYIDANLNLDNFSQQAQQGKDPVLRAFAKKQLGELKRLAKATDQYKGT